MQKQRMALNLKVVSQGAKVAAVVGAGAVAAKVGGRAVMRLSSGATSYALDTANGGKNAARNTALVEAGAGLAVDAVVLLLVGKVAKQPQMAKAMAPFLVGGTLMAAAAPVVADRVVDAIDGVMAKLTPGKAPPPAGYYGPGGFYADPAEGLAGALPGGMYGEPALGLAGALPGGIWAEQRGQPFIGGSLSGRLP